ncbi:MAG TPA: threonine/serine dehydratase [Thermomicrobiales bacterium]|nr:threonine/serine dehydratase [Thermomicrobiales bacterium]
MTRSAREPEQTRADDLHGWAGSIPTLEDVFLARKVIRPYLKPTPLLESDLLSERFGCRVLLKCESLNPTGAFKVRGGIYHLSQLSPEQRALGVVAASTGNHGQSIAYAARLFGAKATIFVPEGCNPMKVAAMKRLGAKVVEEGAGFDEALIASQRFAQETGGYFVHSADEPNLIAGVGTYTLEIMEEAPEVDAIFVPIGAGSGACGACVAGKGIKPSLRVIGIQAEGAPAVYESWRDRELKELASATTFAEGIATRKAFSLPAAILWDTVDDIMLVSDAELRRAIVTVLEATHLVAEGAGAAAVAGAWKQRHGFAGKTIAVVISGGNLTSDALVQALTEEHSW